MRSLKRAGVVIHFGVCGTPKAGLQLESGTARAVVRVLFTSRNLVKSVVNRVTSDT